MSDSSEDVKYDVHYIESEISNKLDPKVSALLVYLIEEIKSLKEDICCGDKPKPDTSETKSEDDKVPSVEVTEDAKKTTPSKNPSTSRSNV
jgi:hypothetical protein